jgi:mRNA interferase HigB
VWLITVSRLNEFAKTYPDAASALAAWKRITAKAEWRSLTELRLDFPSADGVTVDSGKTATVFNIRGGNYRLITAIHYDKGRVYIMRFLRHKEYDKEKWKEQL